MPLYVYRCMACGAEREMLRPAVERDVLPACHGELMPRVATSASFDVKGYSARNNYSKIDTGWRRGPGGVKTRVQGDHVDID